VTKWRVRWAGNEARKGMGETCKEFCWENLRERENWGEIGGDGRSILIKIFKKYDVGYRVD
jgi:hypothetical protein